jgi:cytochrome c-type biogenesis protein CcmH/NrfG
MTDTNKTPHRPWTRKRAIVLSAVCLAVGISCGWFIHASKSPAPAASAKTVTATPPSMGSAAHSQAPGPTGLKQMADAQAMPLLKQLNSDPNNPELLTSIGNTYYDAQQYPTAVDYYSLVLKARPSDAAVRTDMATAYWYMGNVDIAIAEFNKALTYAPTNPSTLFNLGLVKWKGKMDTAGALADWKKLLAANPNYEGKEQVEKMMAEMKQQTAIKSR